MTIEFLHPTGTNEVCHQMVTLTSAGPARLSRIDRSSGVYVGAQLGSC
jgi:hypothetical protein